VQQTLSTLSIFAVLSPLLGSVIAGLLGKVIGRRGAHWVTIILMMVSLSCAVAIFKYVTIDNQTNYFNLYHWAISGRFEFNIGFMIDRISAVMMFLVTFVSTVVHIYSIGYMADEESLADTRFFSYVSLFTFMMLMLVTANNFLQLFFGWEGVGLVSYLLIGYYYYKDSAAVGSLKAFIVNRMGDFGFILGIAAILDYVGSIDYHTVFNHAQSLSTQTMSIFPHTHWSVMTVICILLFIGAMGKSAQMPLHVWLPESMEGPTPISALIHAATMVTAGVFLVARMSPLFEYSQVALSVVLIIGATGALFTGILAFVEFDIKRVIAFSTMSQLGYMMAGDGVSAFPAGIFHLLTHGCFKALLFLAAGSVIIAMHHEQDLRKMGNLKKYMPLTCIAFLIGALSLSAIPPFSGYFSKDSIIEAVHLSTMPGAGYAYWCLVLGAFVTGFYIFRAYFMAFHTKERMPESIRKQLGETHWSMLVALIALAIPATILGFLLIHWILYASPSLLGNTVTIFPKYDVLTQMKPSFHGAWEMFLHSFKTLPFWFAASGIFCAWMLVIVIPKFADWLKRRLPFLHYALVKQYGFDALNNLIFVIGVVKSCIFFYKYADLKLIDKTMVDGTGRNATRVSRLLRRMQSGYLYHYVFIMIIGLLVFLFWLLLG
jgi:NADH-quinone oxidoreductase subunit L